MIEQGGEIDMYQGMECRKSQSTKETTQVRLILSHRHLL